jgi:hypothetical protein
VPPPTGGPIHDGLYVLTAIFDYTGPGGPKGPRPNDWKAVTIKVGGGRWGVTHDELGMPQTSVSGTYWMTATNELVVGMECPVAGDDDPAPVSATSTTMKLYSRSEVLGMGKGFVRELVYTRK